MARIDDNAYQYLLNTYGKDLVANRYDSHKKSELRDVYNRIIKTNKNAPLYKINMNGDVKNFAIDLKENARKMQNVVSSLSTDGEDIESVFYKKIATSSDEDAVAVNYIGDESGSDVPAFTVGVKKLADPQINTGNYLPMNGKSFQEGTYSFDLDTNSKSYEFQYNVAYGDTNYDVQNKIARLFNTSDVGITAKILKNGKGETALQLTSKQTGLAENEEYLFKIQSGSSWNEMKTLGIGQISQEASSSVFSLNDTEHTSLNNTFTINQSFELTLKGTTPENHPAVIGFKANTEAIADSVEELVTSYNGFIAVGQKYSTGHTNNQLLNEVRGIRNLMADQLSSVGIEEQSDGTISLDRDRIAEAVTGDKAKDSFKILNEFKEALSREAQKTSVNPLNYVDKVTVEYKHPTRTFAAPYASSIYSGLLMDQSL